MRIPLTSAAVLGLILGVGTGGATHGDPQKRIARADQARAKGDLVVLMRSRAQVALFFGSGFAAVPRAEAVRLARLTARRMAAAMGG